MKTFPTLLGAPALLLIALLLPATGLRAQTYYFNTTSEDSSLVNIYSGQVGGPAPSLIASFLNTDSNQGAGNMVFDPVQQRLYVNRNSDIFSIQTDGAGYQVDYTLSDPGGDHWIADISVANGILYHAEWQRNLFSDDSVTFRYDGPGGPITMFTVSSYFEDGLNSLLMVPEAQTSIFIAALNIDSESPWIAEFNFPLNLGAPTQLDGANGVGLTYSGGYAYYTDGLAVYRIDLLAESPTVETIISNLLEDVLPGLDINSSQTAIDLDVVDNTLFILTNDQAGGAGTDGMFWSYDLTNGDAALVQDGLGSAISADVVPEPSVTALLILGAAAVLARSLARWRKQSR